MNTELRLFRMPYSDSDLWGGVGQGALSGAAAGTAILPGWGSLAGGLIGGGIALFSGLDQKKKGNDLLNETKYPGYIIPQAEQQNLQIAKAQANQGVASQQYANMSRDIQRNQAAALMNAQSRRSGLAAIAPIQQNSNDAFSRLNAQDAAARMQNQRQLLGVNNQYAGYEDRAFNWNQKNKYNEDWNYGMQLLGAGNMNFTSGLDKIGGALAMLGGRRGFGASRNNYSMSNPYLSLQKSDINPSIQRQSSVNSPAAAYANLNG